MTIRQCNRRFGCNVSERTVTDLVGAPTPSFPVNGAKLGRRSRPRGLNGVQGVAGANPAVPIDVEGLTDSPVFP
jgi:hypothetical protein